MSKNEEEHQSKNLSTELSSTSTFVNPQTKSNQQYIVPLGILIVLFTLYLSTSAFKRTLEFSQTNLKEKENQIQELDNAKVTLVKQKTNLYENSNTAEIILMKLLEYDDKCYDLQIFTKGIITKTYDIDDSSENDETEVESSSDDILHEVSKNTEKPVSKNKLTVKNGAKTKRNGKIVKRLNGKHSLNFKNNKSVNTKILRKKETQDKESQTKKGSTAEPIIYLFALVFIYLLLKAASDINQHYKSQSKGDKRLRRCSLQSYAQSHKPDRRASKESPIKVKHLVLMETRSMSVDRYTSQIEIARKNEMLSQIRRYTSVDEQEQQQQINVNPNWNCITVKNNQLAIDKSVDIMAARAMVLNRQDSMPKLSSTLNRRCSVPMTTLNYPRVNLTSTTLSVVPAITARRTSVTSCNIGVGIPDGTMDLKFPEIKRRVRMINRH